MMYFEYNLKNTSKKAEKKNSTMQGTKMECTLHEAENIFFDTTKKNHFNFLTNFIFK